VVQNQIANNRSAQAMLNALAAGVSVNVPREETESQ
jgi:hypothetical protein